MKTRFNIDDSVTFNQDYTAYNPKNKQISSQVVLAGTTGIIQGASLTKSKVFYNIELESLRKLTRIDAAVLNKT